MGSYDEKLVHEILDEIENHFVFAKNICNGANKEKNLPSSLTERVDLTKPCHYDKLTAYKIHSESIFRNKQLLLAYHNSRIVAISRICWERKTSKFDRLLSPSEKEFMTTFDATIVECKREIGYDFTIIKDPFEEPIVQVLARSDIGERFYASVGRVRLVWKKIFTR